MATSQNILPAEMDWIHELAKNELNPDAQNIFNSVNQFDPRQLIEESTIEFLQELRELFTSYSRLFNGYSNNNEKFSDIKIYGITNTPADFMLFRNNVKLVFANTAHGIINVGFIQHIRGDLAVDGTNLQRETDETKNAPVVRQQSHDILAQTGPFMDVSWTYQGEKVKAERLMKYFFVEFVKASRASKKGSPNQQLIKQIKALLQDQGIDL